jgi:hypothetical protein
LGALGRDDDLSSDLAGTARDMAWHNEFEREGPDAHALFQLFEQ